MKFNLVPLYQTMQKTGLIGWSLLFLAILMGGFSVGMSLGRYHARLEQALRETRATILATEQTSKELEDLDSALAARLAKKEQIERQMLQAGEQAKVISLVTELTDNLGITIHNIQPLERKPEKEIPVKELKPLFFELELEGIYRRLGVFFEALRDADIALTLESVELTPKAPDSERLKAKVVVAAYERI